MALLVAGFAGWPVTALVFRLARTIDDRSDSRADAAGGPRAADGPDADGTVDGEITRPAAAPAQPVEGGAATEAAADSTGGAPAVPGAGTRILRGGAIIGVLERLAVCLAILTGQPVAIAYVVAIKGLGRFAELKETPVAAERFIIGTLTSLLWAAGVAALAKVLFLG
nr:hypothetical protein [Arthrobacter sp. C9C5]